MNICLVTGSFLPWVGGREFVVHNLATALSRRAHKVIVLSAYESRPISEPLEYKVLRAGVKGLGRIFNGTCVPSCVVPIGSFFLAWVVKKYRIDVINVHNVSIPGCWGYHVSKLFPKVPVIGTAHGDDILTVPEVGYGVRLDPKVDKAVRRNLRHFTVVTAISKSMKEEITTILPNKMILEVPNGIWVDEFSPILDKGAVRKKYGIPPGSVAIISVGRNNPVKGFDIALEAFSRLHCPHDEAIYIFVGDKMSPLIEKAKALGLAGRVFFPGELQNAQVAGLLQACDLYVSSSFSESFGLTTLEAMAAGLPCIVTKVPGSKHLVTTDYGIFVKPGNAGDVRDSLQSLIDNPDLREAMGNRAKIAAEQYDWNRISRLYEKIYENAIQEA